MVFARRITAVDARACGEPGRVIVDGVTDIPGDTMFDKMVHLREQDDALRMLMLREPRGYPAANCNLLLPPTLKGTETLDSASRDQFVLMDEAAQDVASSHAPDAGNRC